MTTKRFVDPSPLLVPSFAGANEEIQTAHRRPEQLGHLGRQLCRHALQQLEPDRQEQRRATSRSRGHSPPACCAATKAARSSSATRCTSTRRFRTKSFRSIWPIRRSTGRTRRLRTRTRFPVMCCDTVNRGLAYGDGKIFLQQADTKLVALDAKTGQVVWTRQERRPREGRDQHERAARRQRQGDHGHQRRRVRRARLRRRLRHQNRPASLESLQRRPRQRAARRSAAHDASRQADRRELELEHLGRRAVAARRRHDVGLVHVRPRAESHLLRQRQSRHLESRRAPRRQPLEHDACSRATRTRAWRSGCIR